MKTPRRKRYSSAKDNSDVYNRESGPLEIGELETPNERRSAPVAAVRYLAGSKCHTNSADESDYSENSDYTDARSFESDGGSVGTGSYRPRRSSERVRHSHAAAELRPAGPEHGGYKHLPPVASNFAQEFKLRYASNLASNVQYQAPRHTQDTFLHNMDYIHSQFTNFNPNFINFNYGHFNYPNHSLLANRQPDYYSSGYTPKYAPPPLSRYPEYGYYGPEYAQQPPHDYYARREGWSRGPGGYSSRNFPTDLRNSDNFYRPAHAPSPANYTGTHSYSYGDFTPRSSRNYERSYGDQRRHDFSYEHSRNRPPAEYKHVTYRDLDLRLDLPPHRDARPRDTENALERGRKEDEDMHSAIEKAVKSALDTYISTKQNRGDETCFTNPVYRDFNFDRDSTLTNQQQNDLYGQSYSNNLSFHKSDDATATHKPDELPESRESNLPAAEEQTLPNRSEKERTREHDAQLNLLAFDFKKLGNEIQKVIDDLDQLNQDSLHLHTQADRELPSRSEDRKDALFSSRFSNDQLFSAQHYDKEPMYASGKEGERAQPEGDRESSKLFQPSLFDSGLFVERDDSEKLKEASSDRVYKHLDLFNNEQPFHDSLLEDQMTNRDNESAVLGGSNYDMEGSMDHSHMLNQEYANTTFSDSSFNLNSLEAFGNNAGFEEKRASFETEALDGGTLSTSDLAESRSNLANSQSRQKNFKAEAFSNGVNRNEQQTSKLKERKGNDFVLSAQHLCPVEEGEDPESSALFYGQEPGNSLLYPHPDNDSFEDSNDEDYGHSRPDSKPSRVDSDPESRKNYFSTSQGKEQKLYEDQRQSALGTSSMRKSQFRVDGVSHIAARVDQLEASLRRIESRLYEQSDQASMAQKEVKFARSDPNPGSPSKQHANPDGVSDLELREGYKAAAVIKKLLHVKSMDSLIPAFTAFVQNRST